MVFYLHPSFIVNGFPIIGINKGDRHIEKYHQTEQKSLEKSCNIQ